MPPKRKKPYTVPPVMPDFKRIRLAATAAASLVGGGGPPPPPPPPPAARRGDGVLRVAYVAIGQGDCAVLATPGGRVVMIDCGTSPEFDAGDNYATVAARAQAVLYDDLFIGATNHIDVVIITHPDADHYERFPAVLRPGTTIGRIYHSRNFDDYSTNGANDFLKGAVAAVTDIREVVHNDDPAGTGGPGETTLGGVPVVAGPPFAMDVLDPDGGITVVAEPNCRISILAAGVDHVYVPDHSNPTNRGSVVTLVEARGKKLLFCGDATRATERFLLNRFRARLQDVDLTTIGHHASDRTSSAPDFVQNLRVREAVGSAPQYVAKHHLPSWPVIARYQGIMAAQGLATAVPGNRIRSWHGKKNNWDTVTMPIYTTGSHGTILREFEP
ncbi:hypothetical protein LO762_29650 [Actinocorallia sp. API 0066]|uniref:ComEC/Rec2 family competence protein n=1 Tax=Actinocorallia sp. API 0066 TaxID=2896846 RepID=UPI001E385BA4|nr:MBL fold metallo-hydrolase [Actinocorallia sp. API 0066]MCD0453315.1 hypothetical protein [Actinocorallia sp. API 0066]